MSTLKLNSAQIGQSATATNNFTWYQPASPDGTVRLGVGNAGATSADVLTAKSNGYVGIGTTNPAKPFAVSDGGAQGIELSPQESGTSRILSYNRSTAAYTPLRIQGLELYFDTNATERMRINSSGNVGIGVTPSAWDATYKSLQLPAGSIGSYLTTFFEIDQNAYWSSAGYKYVNNGYASQYRQTNGQHQWTTAASGTAGAAISFTEAMTLDANGNLGIGNGSPSAMNFQSGGGLVVYNSFGQSRLILRNNFTGSTSTDGFQIIQQGTESGNANVNLLQYENAAMLFGTNSAERMRIDSSGNVGIGTSSPRTNLDVAVASQSAVYAGGTGNYSLRLGHDNSGAYVTSINAGTTYTDITTIAQNVIFNTGTSTSTERMRIDSSGFLLVGSTSTGGNDVGFRVYGPYGSINSVTATADYSIFNKSTTATGKQIQFRSANTGVGDITCSSTSTTYNTSSDYRLKENIQPMQNALAVVQQLNPVTYQWKADGSDGQGFIAHELQAVVPDCVTGTKDEVDAEGKPVYQGVDTSFLVATLTKAIQEQQEQINQLKAEVAALKGN